MGKYGLVFSCVRGHLCAHALPGAHEATMSLIPSGHSFPSFAQPLPSHIQPQGSGLQCTLACAPSMVSKLKNKTKTPCQTFTIEAWRISQGWPSTIPTPGDCHSGDGPCPLLSLQFPFPIPRPTELCLCYPPVREQFKCLLPSPL